MPAANHTWCGGLVIKAHMSNLRVQQETFSKTTSNATEILLFCPFFFSLGYTRSRQHKLARNTARWEGCTRGGACKNHEQEHDRRAREVSSKRSLSYPASRCEELFAEETGSSGKWPAKVYLCWATSRQQTIRAHWVHQCAAEAREAAVQVMVDEDNVCDQVSMAVLNYCLASNGRLRDLRGGQDGGG